MPAMTIRSDTAEARRLKEHRAGIRDWKQWGPYVSERAWGTVREDYSPDGAAWDYLPFDHARSKAYRWGEDGIAGISDRKQILCFSPAMWNGRDPTLKERLFGLSNPDGNHGEDVKEVYYYLDATPTHSYLKYLYKYPQAAFPYEQLLSVNRSRSALEPEYELADTGVFDESRYFDVMIEYAKDTPGKVLIRVTATNRGPGDAPLHLLPQMWFRNDWAWGATRGPEPVIEVDKDGSMPVLVARHATLGAWYLAARDIGVQPTLLFTGNETNSPRLYGSEPAHGSRHYKDAFHEYIVNGNVEALSPLRRGTKVGLHYVLDVPAGASRTVDLVLTDAITPAVFDDFDAVMAQRIAEADSFYETVHRPNMTEEEKRIQRQALAGLIWSQQYYALDMRAWQNGDNPEQPPPAQRKTGRNSDWGHVAVANIILMPDKWEYPWFAAWDWAFHVIPLASIDPVFAKRQLELMLSERLLHPNGQIAAYEWAFSEVNPPVQAWAVWRVYNIEKHEHGDPGSGGDLDFLERCFHKLLLNFTWWVNRKDASGRNVFQGGFLGLDNISVFDRSHPLPDGRHLEQADATGWMGLYSLNMLSIALELAQHRPNYEHLAIKFFEHFLAIATAINQEISPGLSLWNEEDGWYYDVVHGVNGNEHVTPGFQLRVRSQVGLIPLFAAMVLKHSWFEHLPNFRKRYEWVMTNRPNLGGGLACTMTEDGTQCLLSIVDFNRLQRILQRTLDETEFLAPFGVRALSRHHLEHPYTLAMGDRDWMVQYEPGESTTRLFGGNSNWRGPIWFPTTFMLITALRVYDRFFGEDLKVECPTGSGNHMTLNQVAMEIARRLTSLFLPDDSGKRPMYRGCPLFESDPEFSKHLLFYEYFHGDTGRGLGASHQTGWTALVAKMIDQMSHSRG